MWPLEVVVVDRSARAAQKDQQRSGPPGLYAWWPHEEIGDGRLGTDERGPTLGRQHEDEQPATASTISCHEYLPTRDYYTRIATP